MAKILRFCRGLAMRRLRERRRRQMVEVDRLMGECIKEVEAALQQSGDDEPVRRAQRPRQTTRSVERQALERITLPPMVPKTDNEAEKEATQ